MDHKPIVIVFSLVYTALCAIEITKGPSELTLQVYQDFELPCEISGRQDADTVFWKLFPHNTQTTRLLTLGTTSKNSTKYTIKSGTWNLQVKNPNYENDGVYECEAGTAKKSARVYVYDKPDSMSLEWQHGENREDAVKEGGSYKLKCTSINSHPPAEHVYFKDGSELSQANIQYEFTNYTNTVEGYGDTVSYLPYTPTAADIRDKSTIRCSAKLWTKINAEYTEFRINSASGVTLSLAVVTMVVSMFALH